MAQALKGSELLNFSQVLRDLGELRADSFDEGIFVTLVEQAQNLLRLLIFLMLFVHDQACPRDDREGQKSAEEGYASLTEIKKVPERNVRDRKFEVTPKCQSCDCTEARDLI